MYLYFLLVEIIGLLQRMADLSFLSDAVCSNLGILSEKETVQDILNGKRYYCEGHGPYFQLTYYIFVLYQA